MRTLGSLLAGVNLLTNSSNDPFACGLVPYGKSMCIPVMLTPSSSDCDPPVLEVLPHPFQWL